MVAQQLIDPAQQRVDGAVVQQIGVAIETRQPVLQSSLERGNVARDSPDQAAQAMDGVVLVARSAIIGNHRPLAQPLYRGRTPAGDPQVGMETASPAVGQGQHRVPRRSARELGHRQRLEIALYTALDVVRRTALSDQQAGHHLLQGIGESQTLKAVAQDKMIGHRRLSHTGRAGQGNHQTHRSTLLGVTSALAAPSSVSSRRRDNCNQNSLRAAHIWRDITGKRFMRARRRRDARSRQLPLKHLARDDGNAVTPRGDPCPSTRQAPP
jgi:hypothetical protein